MYGQPLPNPANRPLAGIQQRVVPPLHLGNRCWRREREGRQRKVCVKRIRAVCTWVLCDPREAVLRGEDEVRYWFLVYERAGSKDLVTIGWLGMERGGEGKEGTDLKSCTAPPAVACIWFFFCSASEAPALV